MIRIFYNLLFFKGAWVACVMGAAAGVPVLGAAAVAMAVTYHLANSSNPKSEALLLGIAAAIGLLWETVLVSAGVLQYGSGVLVSSLAPYWIVAMWVLFATTLNVGMRWLRKNLLVAAVAGAVGGPMSFLAGASAGAVELAHPVFSLLAIGAGWAVLLPVLVYLARRLDGQPAPRSLEMATA